MSAESNNIDCWHDTCTRLQRLDVVEFISLPRGRDCRNETEAGLPACVSTEEDRMNYENGTTEDSYGYAYGRTLSSIEPQRLAQAYLKLIDAYRPSESASPRNAAIDSTARKIARAIAVSLC